MSNFTKVLIVIWSILALINFTASFFIPIIFYKVIGISFGILNIINILTLLFTWIVEKLNKFQRENKDFDYGEM